VSIVIAVREREISHILKPLEKVPTSIALSADQAWLAWMRGGWQYSWVTVVKSTLTLYMLLVAEVSRGFRGGGMLFVVFRGFFFCLFVCLKKKNKPKLVAECS